jgi:hypothetical protein
MRGFGFSAGVFLAGLVGSAMAAPVPSGGDLVFTQLPSGARIRFVSGEKRAFGEGGKIVRLTAGKPRVLTAGFHSAADPEVSFDGSRILFAGKTVAAGPWNIFEMDRDGVDVRQITHCVVDCRSPIYQSAIFYLDDTAPAAQIAYVSEDGSGATAIYSARMDGSGVRRLTYNPAGAFDPAMLPDGRMVFTSGVPGRMVLFSANIDGTDYAAFAGAQGRGMQNMAALTAKRQVVFVEPAASSREGAGGLSWIDLRRNLHSYRRLTAGADGVFHSPSAMPDGSVVAARRMAGGTFGIYRFDPATRKAVPIFHDPATHSVQPKALAVRDVPDGRSSVVDESADWAKLYCISMHDSDLPEGMWPRGLVKRIRVIESVAGAGQTRLIGEVAADEDGSFNVQIPANTPFRVQALDGEGMALRTSGWIWAKNKEQRGCIGCHEDGERTPDNVMATALTRVSANLVLPPERRRSVNYERDIAPIFQEKCGNAACHAGGVLDPRYVTAGTARTSPLVWAVFGKNTSRPWDSRGAARPVKKMPPEGSPALTEAERRAVVEWIDLGAPGARSPGGAK